MTLGANTRTRTPASAIVVDSSEGKQYAVFPRVAYVVRSYLYPPSCCESVSRRIFPSSPRISYNGLLVPEAKHSRLLHFQEHGSGVDE